ncbi:MAG: hypothetical protein IJF69_02075 [Clostridia bacterium]|nr:hypothetical protein [Clostridia bacterium]
MKKIISLLIALVIVAAVAAGCGCKHEWKEADCTTPKTCSLCSVTEGEAAGHKWLDATCTAAKSCKNCDATEGEALGHDWQDATTEAPTTCARCKVTEGSKIETDPRFTTASTKEFYGKWSCEVVFTAEMLGMEDYIENVPATIIVEFKNAGEFITDVKIHDQDAFMDALGEFTKDYTYYTLYLQGYDEATADQAMLDFYGMTMDEYIEAYLAEISLGDIFGAFVSEQVYYVGQNGIYSAPSWYDEFEPSEYTIEDDTLIINEITLEEEGEPLVFKKVVEE